MASISGQMEAMYMSHSRKDMNDTLTAVMLAACVSPALMPERLLMEHILLVSILHHNVGLEVRPTSLPMRSRALPLGPALAGDWQGRRVKVCCHTILNVPSPLYHTHLWYDIYAWILIFLAPTLYTLGFILFGFVSINSKQDCDSLILAV